MRDQRVNAHKFGRTNIFKLMILYLFKEIVEFFINCSRNKNKLQSCNNMTSHGYGIITV